MRRNADVACDATPHQVSAILWHVDHADVVVNSRAPYLSDSIYKPARNKSNLLLSLSLRSEMHEISRAHIEYSTVFYSSLVFFIFQWVVERLRRHITIKFQFQYILLIELEHQGKNSCTDKCPLSVKQ